MEGRFQQDRNNAENTKYVPTDEEMQVLRQCRTEAFWYRCIPFSIVTIGTVQIFVKRGILKAHPRFGSIPKVIGAGILGYGLGKLSYIKACSRKILELGDSPMARSIRQGTPLSSVYQGSSVGTGQAVETEPVNQSRIKQDYVSSGDMNTERQQAKGLDESKQPNMNSDKMATNQQSPLQDQRMTSYDELRAKNRSQGGRVPSASPWPRTSAQNPPPQQESVKTSPTQRIHRNQYGDIVEDSD